MEPVPVFPEFHFFFFKNHYIQSTVGKNLYIYIVYYMWDFGGWSIVYVEKKKIQVFFVRRLRSIPAPEIELSLRLL